MSDETGYQGELTPNQAAGTFNAMNFLVQQMLARVNTATLVKVVSVTNAGGVEPVGFVDVQPLVNQLDGADKAVPHGVVRGLPYFRIQGGANAVILDPEVGDIGIAVFASKDISAVKATKAQANPGSSRRFNMADGMFLGGVLNGTPSQYVQFDASGITVNSPTKVNVVAPDVAVNCDTAEVNAQTSTTVTCPTSSFDGNVTITGTLGVAGVATVGALSSTGAAGASAMTGDLNVTGDVTANGTSLHTHTHGGVSTGTGNTGAPN